MTLSKRSCGMLTAVLLMATAATAQKVRVDSTPGFDFSDYKRYTWRVHPVFEKKPELADKYSVGIELVKNAVNQNLLARGFQSTQGPSEFFITFLLTAENKQDIDVVYTDGAYGWGGWYGWNSFYYPGWTETVVTNYLEGTLVLDVVDAKTDQLVWRAYCRDEIRDWRNRDKNVQKAVDKALKRFPPKSK
jgi:Domain of unknown function (DUF4136)